MSVTTRPRRNEAMKFAYAGPYVRLLNEIRPVKPERGPSGIVLRNQPRYAASSPESWTIGASVGSALASALEALFGREYGSTLDDALPDEPCTSDCSDCSDARRCLQPPVQTKPKRRRGTRGGRGRKKAAAS